MDESAFISEISGLTRKILLHSCKQPNKSGAHDFSRANEAARSLQFFDG